MPAGGFELTSRAKRRTRVAPPPLHGELLCFDEPESPNDLTRQRPEAADE
jgi:hypothetical protein